MTCVLLATIIKAILQKLLIIFLSYSIALHYTINNNSINWYECAKIETCVSYHSVLLVSSAIYIAHSEDRNCQ